VVGKKESQPFQSGSNTKAKTSPQQQARIELLDSEDDNSGNETASSADINSANRNYNGLSDNESD
jgi:hypothetical protein